jgi:hypothetical protein
LGWLDSILWLNMDLAISRHCSEKLCIRKWFDWLRRFPRVKEKCAVFAV